MPRAEQHKRRTARALRILLLSAGTAAFLPFGHAVAQQASDLRGEVTESEIAKMLKRKPASGTRTALEKPVDSQTTEGVPTPQYVPVSEGAVPDEEPAPTAAAGSSLFDPQDEGDEAAIAPIPPRRPSTARQRAEEAQARAGQQPEAAAERTRADTAATDEETTGTVRQGKADADERKELTLDEGAQRAEAIEGLDRLVEDNPFEAPGIRAGTFILRPSIEQGVTATTNADSSTRGKSSVLSETTLRLNAVSDWSEHAATLDAYGIFKKSISGENVSEGEGGFDASLMYELSNETHLNAAIGYDVRPESASSPGIVTGTVKRPLRHTLDGSLGFEKNLGKLRLGVTGRVERDMFADAKLTNGTTDSQEDRNSTPAAVTLRTGYEISPALTPFVEVEVGRRAYDLKQDSAGYERSSLRTGARAGVALDMGEKLTGEFSAGWIREGFDDDRLAAISGASVNANVNWSPERGTTVGLTGQTTVEGTTAANESGSILYSGRLSLQREIRANLTGGAILGADWRDYYGKDGRDLTLSAEASLTWWLNRYAGLTGRYRYETLDSTLADRDSKTNSIFLGLKLQR